MTNIIEISAHRPAPGTLWWQGHVGCTVCGHAHVAVAPIPDWASSPPSLECPHCGCVACVPVADGCEPRPWSCAPEVPS